MTTCPICNRHYLRKDSTQKYCSNTCKGIARSMDKTDHATTIGIVRPEIFRAWGGST